MKNNLSSYIIPITKYSNSLKTTPKHYSESQLSKKNSNSLLINSNKKSNSSYLNSTPYNNYYKNDQKIINFQKPTYSEIQKKIINSHNSSNKKKKKNLKKNLSIKDKAAIKIQSCFRGYINRLTLYNHLKIFYENNKELIWSIYVSNNPTSYLNDVFYSKNLPAENMRKIIDKYKNYLIDGNEENYNNFYNNNNFNENNNELKYHYNISSYYKNKEKNNQIINNELNEKIEDENNLYNNNNNFNNIDNENDSYIKNTLNNNLIKKIKNKEKEKINNIKTLKNKLLNIFLIRKKNIFFKLKIFYDFCVKNNYNFNILINIGFFNTNKNNNIENDSEEKNNFIDDNIVNNNNINNYNEYKNNNNNSSSNSYRKKIYKNYSNNNINNKTNSDDENEPYLNEIEDPDLTKKVCQYLLIIDHKLNGTKYDEDNSKNNNEQLFRIFRRAFISNNNNNIANSVDNNILNYSIILCSKINNNIEKNEVIYKI